MATRLPLVVEIRRHSLEDGPGIRSVVFLKGCGLRCSFCQNPEAQDPLPEIVVSRTRCIACGSCAKACPEGAADPDLPGHVRRDLCRRCGACADACPSGALRRIGTALAPADLAEVLLRDLHFYRLSGGGVTVSGGEPAIHPGYLGDLLPILKAEEIHVALETGGHFPRYDEVRRRILRHVDLVLFSLKLADAAAHRVVTGASNRRIIENLGRLVGEPELEVEGRIPLVPGVTDTRENLAALVAILRDAGVERVELQPYSPLGVSMAESLGRPPPPAPSSFPARGETERVRRVFEEIVERAVAGPVRKGDRHGVRDLGIREGARDRGGRARGRDLGVRQGSPPR